MTNKISFRYLLIPNEQTNILTIGVIKFTIIGLSLSMRTGSNLSTLKSDTFCQKVGCTYNIVFQT